MCRIGGQVAARLEYKTTMEVEVFEGTSVSVVDIC